MVRRLADRPRLDIAGFEPRRLWLEKPFRAPELSSSRRAAARKQAAGRSIRELDVRRDDYLVELMALVQKYWREAEGRLGRL